MQVRVLLSAQKVGETRGMFLIVLDLTSSKTASGCSFSVTRKANPSLHISKDCVGPCIKSTEQGCACIAGGSTASCPTDNNS
jgi:hypothetical protein